MTFDSNFVIILAAALAAAIALFLLLRARRPAAKIERKPPEPYVASRDRPYVKRVKDLSLIHI